MADEVDVEEEMSVLLGKLALHGEEAVIERLGARAPHRSAKPFPVPWLLRANLDLAPVVERF